MTPLYLIDIILVLLVIAVSMAWVFWRFKLPILLGYIIMGILVGPYVFGWMRDTQIMAQFAEFGVVFLLFTIGLEFSLSRLISMSNIVFGYGGLQVFLTMLATVVIGLLIGLTLPESIVIAGIVATSSTAIVMKQLTEQGEIHSPEGRNAIGILLFQDLAVIPLLIIIPSLAGESLMPVLGWAFIKGIIAIVLILSIGRWLISPLFHRIAETKSSEIFTFTVLLVALGSAWLSHFLGLSLALGAFVAGVMLAETEFRHQIGVEMRPFRDVLLALFFISIGMQFNIAAIPGTWQWMLLLFSALVVFKTILISVLGLLFHNDRIVSFKTGLILAQGSEFGFTILFLASKYQILPADYGEVVLGALLLSVAASSLLIRYNSYITYWVDSIALIVLPPIRKTYVEDYITPAIATTLQNHVIICGFEQMGQYIVQGLARQKIPHIIIEVDNKVVKRARSQGYPAIYGDSTQYELLEAAGIEKAKAVLINIKEPEVALKTVEQIRKSNKKVFVISRCMEEDQVEQLLQRGASHVFSEKFEISLTLLHYLLRLFKLSPQEISKLMIKIRKEHESLKELHSTLHD